MLKQAFDGSSKAEASAKLEWAIYTNVNGENELVHL